MSLNNPKKDTPIKKGSSSSRCSNKEPTLSDVWNLLVNLQSTVQSQDTNFKNINNNLQVLENNFKSMQSTLKNLHTELSQLQLDKSSLESELILLRDKLDKLEKSTKMIPQSYNNDVFTEVKDRLSREKNILVFNVPEEDDQLLNIGVDLLKDLSLPNIKITRSKRLGTISSKNRPILLELDSPFHVHEVLKSKTKLRSIDRWRQVSISEDKTITQRIYMKQLRSELLKKRELGENNWFIKYNRGIPSLVQKN